MKKQLKLALVPAALAVLSTGASAQLQISGRLDMGVLNAPVNLTTGTQRNWQVAESSNARLNFSGREDLGGGLTAFFMIEHRFFADTGAVTDANAFWRDKSWVGLNSNSLGEVKIGRVHSPQYGLGVAGRYEAFFGDSYASMGTRGAKSANQWNNSVYYTTPNFAGVTAGVVLQAGESTRTRGEGGHLNYARGPLSVALSYQKEHDSQSNTLGDTFTTWTLGGYYDFGFARFMTTYAKSTDVNITNTGDEVVYTFGARIPVGSGEIRTSFRKINDTDISARNNKSADRDSARLSLGYAHFLSKRTSVNLSLVRENQIRYNAAGVTTSDFTGTGWEAALRVQF
jgi:predicted porin